jgi:N-acetylglucosaminyldiphosphoundecaprenol N-acetyl-beta-D-mannosaminyltransferase
MPKQEYFAFRYRREQTTLNAPLLLCVGAAMEFALGQKKRAPLWMQNRHGMVLASRQRTAPLCGSYTTQGSKYIGILLRERRAQRQQRQQ